METSCGIRWAKYLGLVLGCLGQLVTGSVYVFNVYMGTIKRTFNYTQREVELQSSLLYMGQGVCFLPGMFFDRYGPTWTLAIGLVLAVASYVLLWTTPKAVTFYTSRSWLMGIYFFVAGLGSAFTYMVVLNTNLINFNQKQRGKVMGALNLFFAGSPFIYSLIYYYVFDGTETNNIDSFPQMMLLLAVSFAVVNSLCMPFLRMVPGNTEKENSRSSDDLKGISNDLCMPFEKSQPMSLKLLAGNCTFHSLLWMFTLTAAVGVFETNNLTEIATSVHFDQYNPTLVLLIPSTVMVVSVILGVFSDKYIGTFPRPPMFLVGTMTFVISQILLLLLADVFSVLILATMLIGIGNAFVWTLGPALMADMLYTGNLGRNWGILILINAMFCFALQETFGTLYENAITTPDELFCSGLHCLRASFGIGLACVVLAFIPALVLVIRSRTTSVQNLSGESTVS